MVARNWSNNRSLWSRVSHRLFRQDLLAILKVDRKLAMLMFSHERYSSFTRSFGCIVAGGPLL